ncbi:MAG TPA: hypothetical protein VK753_10175 [Xanthomonadaceae bacterium]|jgi:hypothetical protein|nr:hypothetical protein [Xanthomonadaceae bacterium]
MKPITVSEPVWQAIAARGKFGETEDDVLRRVFGLTEDTNPPGDHQTNQASQPPVRPRVTGPRQSFATDRLSSYISGNELRVSFASGPSNSWVLPKKTDKAAIRVVRDKATSFAEKHGATIGQINAVRKTLTDAEFHLNK